MKVPVTVPMLYVSVMVAKQGVHVNEDDVVGNGPVVNGTDCDGELVVNGVEADDSLVDNDTDELELAVERDTEPVPDCEIEEGADEDEFVKGREYVE